MEQLQVYDRSVHRIAREDETARYLMTAPGRRHDCGAWFCGERGLDREEKGVPSSAD